MKNYVFVIVITVLFFGVNNIIAMDSHEKRISSNINKDSKKQDNGVFIIKNEFLTTYIEELTEATRSICNYYAEKNNKLSSKIRTINDNVNKVLNTVLKDTVNSEGLQNIIYCIRNLGREYTEDTILNSKLYRIILNCHSILNELKCQCVTSIIDDEL